MPEEVRKSGDGLTNRELPQIASYTDILTQIQHNPYSDEIWEKTVTLARAEELIGEGTESFYTHLPLDELIGIGQRLRATRVKEEQYDILTERASTGEDWYDIVLGHVNDKSFAPIAKRLQHLSQKGNRKWQQGLDVGTGTGNTLRTVAPFFENVTGVDRIESVLQIEKRNGRLPNNAQVLVGDATKLPVAKNIIDIAVSNGLAYYLSREELQQYIRELGRVIKPGGKYFESFVTKKADDDLLPIIEHEYLTSAKALLTCLIDNLVSHQDPTKSQWNLRDIVDTFREQGFIEGMSEPNEDGVWFIEFRKKII